MQLGNPTGMYGAERWILALVKYLDPGTIRSVVGVIQDKPGAATPELCVHVEKLGLPTIEFEAPGKLSLSAISQIRRFVKDENIDILHTHGYKTDIIGRLATIGTSCRIVATPHGWSQDAGPALRMYEALDRLCFMTFDKVVPLSQDLYAGLTRIPFLKRKLKVITNGVDIGEIRETGRRQIKTELSGNVATFTIGYIGQLIHRKRIDTLITAFSKLEIDSKRLILIGEGPQRGQYEQLAKDLGIDDVVHFLGFRSDRIELLMEFDVFALASELEGIPRCVMEAMAAGVPVIASKIPGCTDIVRHEINGLLFEVGNHDELARHMHALMQDPALRQRLCSSARKTVEREFSAQRMADEYRALFLSLTGKTSSGPQSTPTH